MKKYVISEFHGEDFHAGPKAQKDIETILVKQGVVRFKIGRLQLGGAVGKWLNRICWLFTVFLCKMKLPKAALIIMQYPSAAWSKSPVLRLLNKTVKERRKLILVTIVHDITSLRGAGVKMDNCDLAEDEMSLFTLFDRIIVHNKYMAHELQKRGVDPVKMVCLECFDYLANGLIMSVGDRVRNDVVIAGNLMIEKCGYLARLSDIGAVQWRLYGVNFDPSQIAGTNIRYGGCFSPEDLPSRLEGSFGLVWDGMSIETCSGAYGEYLRVNNPHKMSLYLASGIPVIVWKEAATASFVQENGLGLIVEALSEIPGILAKLSLNDYAQMRERVLLFAKKLRGGHFTILAYTRVVAELALK